MSDPTNTDNLEAFLFELNELLIRHNASLKGSVAYPKFMALTMNGQGAFVKETILPGIGRRIVIDPAPRY